MNCRCNGNRVSVWGSSILSFSIRADFVWRIIAIFVVAILAWCAPARAQNDADLAALGIRKISGKHIDLLTDLRDNKAVDELPRVFDAAVPQLERYFELPAGTLDKWHVRATLMQDKN